jgi:di/tricarboxylate transporter
MTLPEIFLLIVIAIAFYLILSNRLRMDVAAMCMAIILGAAQFFGMGMLGKSGAPNDAVKALSGFGQPIIFTLISLFILSRALDKSGVTRWIVRRLLRIGGTSERRLIVLFAGTTALLSLVMNNLAAGALLLPSAMEVCRRTGIRPSKLLIPVSFGSLLGGTATYFTTANIIVSGLLPIAEPAQQQLSILAFTHTGGLIVIAGLFFFWLFGQRLLPDRNPPPEVLIARPTATELEDFYHLGERMWEARILPTSDLVGQSLAQSAIGRDLGVSVMAIWHGEQAIFSPPPSTNLQVDDILLLIGREERITHLTSHGLAVGRNGTSNHISTRGVTMAEVMLTPHSRASGQTLKELDFRSRYGFTAVALLRKGQSFRTNVGDFNLELGDTILVVGTPKCMQSLRRSPDYIVLEASQSDQPVDRRQSAISIGMILMAIIASVIGFPVYLSMLVGAFILLLAKVLSVEEAYNSVEWQAIFLIAGMYAVSLAMVQTGLAERLGNFMTSAATPLGPLGLAAGAYLLTALLTQVMGGQVAALVTGPIMISAAISMGTNAQAIAVATAIGCSASFFTPLAHPVNILMITPANYKFSDFFRIGWRLSIVSFIVLLAGMALFWKLYCVLFFYI